jgi:hypothetical protein
LRGTFNAALLREDADKLEVRSPSGELVFFAKLPEEPRDKVRDWPLFGILPWADPDLRNKTMGSSGSERAEEPTQKKPKDDGSGGGTPHKGSSPESDSKRSSLGGEKPGTVPGESEPGGGLWRPPPYEPPSPDQAPPDGQYRGQP